MPRRFDPSTPASLWARNPQPGNSRSSSIRAIVRPTTPVPPTTATVLLEFFLLSFVMSLCGWGAFFFPDLDGRRVALLFFACFCPARTRLCCHAPYHRIFVCVNHGPDGRFPGSALAPYRSSHARWRGCCGGRPLPPDRHCLFVGHLPASLCRAYAAYAVVTFFVLG